MLRVIVLVKLPGLYISSIETQNVQDLASA